MEEKPKCGAKDGNESFIGIIYKCRWRGLFEWWLLNLDLETVDKKVDWPRTSEKQIKLKLLFKNLASWLMIKPY